MSNFTDFISGGGSASYPTIFLHNSQTWVPPQDGNIMIHVIGAGGSGCSNTVTTALESGAAGGYCRKNSLAVTTSGSFTVVVGAGGASVYNAVGAGIAGGNSTVAGTGLGSTLTATGGAGGALANNTYTTAGTASNGDVNYAGGRGGYYRGGGAVGLTGTGNDGGGPGNVYNYGGDCDILGDFYSSSLGQLSGSGGGAGQYVYTSGYDGFVEAGPLAGGGSIYKVSTYSMVAGHSAIGGGGGWCQSTYTSSLRSGRGGEGCVVIQYIP
tara:strand:+ start:22267 stop:23070 length:804 start_codon:yes stop_codon:yes gene_type:complete